MTNDELIKKIKTQINFEKKSKSEYNIGRRDAYTNVLILFKQLEEPTIIASKNEPELPVIPQFVADWLEENKSKFSILDVSAIVRTEGLVNQKVDDWICKNDEMFVRAWIEGYAVEKEKLYKVLLPGVESLDRQMCMHEETKVIGFTSDGYNSRKYSKDDEFIRLFTEQEIKTIDPRYWSFAEEVPE